MVRVVSSPGPLCRLIQRYTTLDVTFPHPPLWTLVGSPEEPHGPVSYLRTLVPRPVLGPTLVPRPVLGPSSRLLRKTLRRKGPG